MGVRKLTKVGQVPLALPNPLFQSQPLETPPIPPRAVAGGVVLLLQNWTYFACFQSLLLQNLQSALFQLVLNNTQERCGCVTLVCFSFLFSSLFIFLFLFFFFPFLFLFLLSFFFFSFSLFWQEILLPFLLHKYEVNLWKQIGLLLVYMCKTERTVLLIKLVFSHLKTRVV